MNYKSQKRNKPFIHTQKSIHTQKRKAYGGIATDDTLRNVQNQIRTKPTSDFGFYSQIKEWALTSGVPPKFLDTTHLDEYVPYDGDLLKLETYAHKLNHLTKVLDYLKKLEKALEDDNKWNDRFKKAFEDNRLRLKEAFMPPRLSTSNVRSFNDAGDEPFLYLVLKGEDDDQYTNVSEECKTFVEEKHRLSTNYDTYKKKITGPINEQSSHAFLREWKKIGKLFEKAKTESVRDEYYFLRWEVILKFFEKEFKDAKELTLPQTPDEYIAVNRADQRQLLMLLCGDVPAELFVDAKTGHIRNEQQISHHILFLTKPYQMSNTRMGIIVQNVNWFVNTVKNGTVSFSKALFYGFLTVLQAVGLFVMVYEFYKHDKLHKGFQNIIHLLLHIVVKLFQIIMRMTGLSKSKLRVFKYVKNVDELGRMLLTTTGAGLLWYFLKTAEIDIGHNQRSSLMFALYRKALDQWNLTKAMGWLSQLQPGMFGESTVSGISDDQLGLMQKVQDNLVDLDLAILKTNQANMEEFRNKYVDSEQSRDRQKLWADLNVAYHATQSSYVNPRKLRAQLLKNYPHEFRAHHFFDSYGFPRSALQIVLAYFCNWDREEREQNVPTVPYNDNKVHEYLHPEEYNALKRSKTLKGSFVHLNPIQSSEFYRKNSLFNPDKVVHDTNFVDGAELHEEDTKEREEREVGERNIKARINLTDIFTHEKGYVGWIESQLPNNEEAIEQFRKISGWTHKISPIVRRRLIREFNLNTRRSIIDYKQFVARQLRYQDKTADYQPTGTNAFYLVNESYDYNIFHQNNKNYMRGKAYDELLDKSFDTFFNTHKDASGNTMYSTDAEKLQYYQDILVTLQHYEPFRSMFTTLRLNNMNEAEFARKNKKRIQNGLMEVLGLYIQTYDSSEVERVLRYRTPDQRKRTRLLLIRQYKSDASDFLNTFIDESKFENNLEKWDKKKSSRKSSGGRNHKKTVKHR